MQIGGEKRFKNTHNVLECVLECLKQRLLLFMNSVEDSEFGAKIRVVPNSRQPAELTSYLGRFFKDKLFVPLLAQIYENETYFTLQFVDLKIIWLAQRYTITSSLH